MAREARPAAVWAQTILGGAVLGAVVGGQPPCPHPLGARSPLVITAMDVPLTWPGVPWGEMESTLVESHFSKSSGGRGSPSP